MSTGPIRTGQRPRRSRQRLVSAVGAAATALVMLAGCSVTTADSGDALVLKQASAMNTATPIKHTVVIFGENISFDHYFGTYPNATNADGTPFHAAPNTPKVNGLTPHLLTNNPNSFNPKRLSPSQALTCDQDHGYRHEQQAFDNGAMDRFVQSTETDACTGQPVLFGESGLVMDYYDGNTVTGMWNYAQNFALNDNSYGTTFGPSTPGALNLVAGQTRGATAVTSVTHQPINDTSIVGSPDANHVGTIFNDADPAFDDCSDNNHTATGNLVEMNGPNIGDLLNSKGVTWGWFEGGFRPTGSAKGFAVCGSSHANVGGLTQTDYSPHHEPFQYYRSTSNPKHLPPSSAAAIGQTDRANHQYDITDFDTALAAGNLPAVSFLKAPRYEDAHPANSDPLDEQQFVVDTINKLEKSPDWNSTAIVLAYDDSDGWYDHQVSPITNGSADSSLDTVMCTAQPPRAAQQDRCGYGPRLPLMVVSAFSRQNFVDHTVTDQSSVLKFIENNWHLGELGGGSFDARAGALNGMFDFSNPHFQPVLLDPKTGAVTR